MGLAYSLSVELWIRLVRYWKQYLAYQQQQVELHGAGASSLETTVNKVGLHFLLQTATKMTCCYVCKHRAILPSILRLGKRAYDR